MFSRGFLGTVPKPLISAVLEIADVKAWSDVYVACSGTFRTEQMAAKINPNAAIHSNDVSLFSVSIGRWLTGQDHHFTFVRDLAWLEDIGIRTAEQRIAALIVLLNTAAYSTGSRNRYKDAHVAHFRSNFLRYVDAKAAKLPAFRAATPVTSFFAGDWLAHLDSLPKKQKGGHFGCLAYPPTYKGGYEKMFSVINENVEWEGPGYEVWDPARIGDVVERLEAAGVPYFVYADRLIPGRAPAIEFNSNGYHTVYGYARAQRSAYLRTSYGAGKQFGYVPIDIGKLTPDSVVRVVPATGDQLTFLKNCYLKHSIVHTPGRVNLLVYIDGMLVGGLIYRNLQAAFEEEAGVFLLSDFSISRESRLAKLVARIATTQDVIRYVRRIMVLNITYVTTAVFSDNPVSMKYRGVFELTSRKEGASAAGKYTLYYKSMVRNESAQDAYRWWAERNLGKAGNKNRDRRPETVEAA